MRPIRSYNLIGRSAAPVEYERYLRFQARLRDRRRECLIFCEHPATITAGIQSRPESLISSATDLDRSGVALLSVARAGDHTAHEPGQCVIYPHVDLRARGLGVAQYFHDLLECVSSAMAQVWSIDCTTRADAPGLYLANNGAKIASIGILFKSFFTSFGVAVNVTNDLRTFTHIHPCGFVGQRIASVAGQTGDPGLLTEFIADFSWRFEKMIVISEN